ncbi:hypothetical protein CHARACLAT_030902 [Characodon lateralis]|uniref:Uncharacterized protein n=1 Tax=Characodon lateralis TaxID=208331 RepID=A0ABU7EYB7_9TELE|nr:hypothetical protein [Characodon lateralis]
MSPCWQADTSLRLGSRVTTITCNKVKPPEATLIKVDFPHGLEMEAGTASHAFLCARPGGLKQWQMLVFQRGEAQFKDCSFRCQSKRDSASDRSSNHHAEAERPGQPRPAHCPIDPQRR